MVSQSFEPPDTPLPPRARAPRTTHNRFLGGVLQRRVLTAAAVYRALAAAAAA